MQFVYDQFIMWRRAKGRIFCVNANMPFEFFISCFQNEQPFFLLSQLEDGRVAITPNALCIPWNLQQTGFWPQELLPKGFEYFTMKHGTYPVLVTAHPITDFEGWYRKFEMGVQLFAQETLAQFISSSYERLPVKFEEKVGTLGKKEVLPV